MDKPLKVATPPLALRGFVPLSVPGPPGAGVPAVIASVMEAVLDTVLPNWSCTVTAGCVNQAVPPVPPPGWVVKASLLAAPAISVRLPKLLPVEPSVEVVMPATVAVPPPEVGRYMFFPVANGEPAVGRTCILVVLPIVSVSVLPVPLTLMVTVIVEESVITTLAAVMFLVAVKVMLGVTVVLNSKPAGAFRMRVWLFPLAKSPFAPSAIEMLPLKVVHAAVPPAAEVVSAEMPVPPEKPVTVTVAHARPSAKSAAAKQRNGISRLVFIFIFMREKVILNQVKGILSLKSLVKGLGAGPQGLRVGQQLRVEG